MVGKAEASATLTVHGKTEYCDKSVYFQPNIFFTAPRTAILNLNLFFHFGFGQLDSIAI